MAEFTPGVKKLWIKIRNAWGSGMPAFSNSMSLLSDKESNALYDLVKLSLFKNSYAEAIHVHPELRDFLKNDLDRACMYAIYEHVSWKLNRREDPPRDMKIAVNFKRRIGRTYTGTSK